MRYSKEAKRIMKCKTLNIVQPWCPSLFGNGNTAGFTLLELLIVLSILAIIAAGVVVAYQNLDDDAGLDLARHEILEIKTAFLNFRRDTGYFPKQGPFSIFSITNQNGRVFDGCCGIPGGSHFPEHLKTEAQRQEWFHSPANFWQLYGRDEPCPVFNPDWPILNPRSPICATGHPLEAWNPDSRRGWNGPYLQKFGEGMVDIGNGLISNGSGSPLNGTNLLEQVPGVADPFEARPVSTGLGDLLRWRATPGGNHHDRWGRPYLVFNLEDEDAARVVSMGPNRQYETCDRNDDGFCDQIDLDSVDGWNSICEPQPNSDDLVACLLR